MAVAPSPSRRDELRAFLRSRRARLSPADVGLADDGGRRRTPGLRREELASLAGVGVSWYTWLEQGRDIHPSPEVLEALAGALRLDAAERATLFALARTGLPLTDRASAVTGEPDGGDLTVLTGLVDALHPHPAYLLGPLTRVLAWNAAASVLLGPIEQLPLERRLLLWWLFVEPGLDPGRPEQHATARNMLGRFRAEYAMHVGDPQYEQLIATLRQRSGQFALWWDEHQVIGTQRGTKTLQHPTLGLLRLYHSQTIPTGAPDLRLTVYAPADDATRAALAKL